MCLQEDEKQKNDTQKAISSLDIDIGFGKFMTYRIESCSESNFTGC